VKELDIFPLELHRAGLSMGGKRVLKDIDCQIGARPQKTFVIGPNGAGKSLFLKLCHGLLQAEEGTVHWGGVAGKDARLAQAMVFQRPVMLRRSALGNIDYALRLRGIARAERRDRTEALLKRTGLGHLAKVSARALSFGEQQRLALARALAFTPLVLFLDEPTASLDPAAAHLVEDIIEEAAVDGTKVIMSSHDLGQAQRMADEVIFLHRGRIKEFRIASDFFAAPKNDLARDFLEGKPLWWRRRSIYRNGGAK